MVLVLSYIFLIYWTAPFFTTTWFCFVEYSRYTLASCIANISTADIWCNAWQSGKIQTTKFKNKWIVKEQILNLQVRCSSYLVVEQWSNLHPIHTDFAICPDVPQHYKFNTCSHTEVMLLCIYTRITYLNTTDTKRDKFETPVSKIEIESNLPKAILLPYPFKAQNTSKLYIQIQFLPCSPS
jgi:hypothetical protein